MKKKIANDNISKLLGGVDKKFNDSDDFIDIVQWNLRRFNSQEPERVTKIIDVLSLLNSDVFVFQEIAPASLDGVLLQALNHGGVLIYETFMIGNERFGKPSNPDLLLRSHELFERVADACTVLAYEQGEVAEPKPAAIQRICAVKGPNPSLRLP